MSAQEALRGKSRLSIQRKAKKQKFMFVAALLRDCDTIKAACAIIGCLPQQIRRWRKNDPEFDSTVLHLERLNHGTATTDDELAEISEEVRAYLTKLKQELKSESPKAKINK